MSWPRVILASTSPRRAELLRQVPIDFEIVPSGAREDFHEQLTGRELAQLHAYRKARAVAKQNPDAIVVGADTVVCLGTRLFGKPSSFGEAQRMLRDLQGETHQVVTGVCLVHLRTHKQFLFAEATEVTFRSLDADQIDRYLHLINPLDKAGGYAIQEHGHVVVERIVGSYTNVVGLPMERLLLQLQALNGAG